MKITKEPLAVISCISAVCIICFCLPFKVGLSGLSLSGILLFHFFHANIFHMALNLWGLIAYKPLLRTSFVAYICATIAGACPLTWVAEPTYGLSAFLFACYARRYAIYRISPVKVLGIQILVGLLPHMNWRIHVLSFLLSYLFWRIYYAKR